MKNSFLLIVFLMFSFICKAQSSNSDNAQVSLSSKYNANVLAVYQEHSKSKIEDLFTYFQMLTNASLSDDLKKEVVTNINQLYRNKNAMIIDFTSESFDKIPLQEFIQKLLISDPITFSVSEEANFNSVTFQNWKTVYTITRTKSGISSKIKVNQIVFMYNMAKEFGDKTKIVTNVLLDEMQ
ncbi:MAG: hypothetical protein K2P85_07930 [Flavobacteriaceae bacterium]|nr:hypothetical protein [Flavobacteriaceae bacterium]